jgi:nucleoside-diphosphate-sugar epimerase
MIRFATNLATGAAHRGPQGSARGWLHVSDAVRAIEAATRVERYAVVNIGHPDVRPSSSLRR